MLLSTEKDQKYVWFYNINQEQTWNQTNAFPKIVDSQQDNLMVQQEQQLLLISNPLDKVLIRHNIDQEFLAYLRANGFLLPQMVKVGENVNWASLYSSTSEDIFVPYIVTEEVYQMSLVNNVRLFGSQSELVKRINDKFYCRRLLESLELKTTKGFFCNSIDELLSAYDNLTKQGFNKVVIKIPYGSSGKGLKIIENETKFYSYLNYLKRRAVQFSLLMEGWHQVDRNINAQLLVESETIRILSVNEQIIDQNGMYLGTNFTNSIGGEVLNSYKKDLYKIGEFLQSEGYQGIAGVDSFIDHNGEIYPAVEINGRFTQVTYLLPTVQRLSESYDMIQSRFTRLSSSKFYGFNEMLQLLNNELNPDSDNKFLIYTFASVRDGNGINTKYRIFLLFYGRSEEKVNHMIMKFEEIQNKL